MNTFHYAVDYCGASLQYSVIFNLTQTWLPQPIAFTFDAKCSSAFLYTIPFKFHRFGSYGFSSEVKNIYPEQELITRYGEGAYIEQYSSQIPADLSSVYTVMQNAYHIEQLTLYLPYESERNAFELNEKLYKPISIQQQQQQRFYLNSLCLEGNYCNSMVLIQLLIDFGLHLRKLHIDFNCLQNLIDDHINNTRLKIALIQRNRIYFEIDVINESKVDSGDFYRVIHFLFDVKYSVRHVTLFPAGNYLKLHESIEDMRFLINILSSFKHCTQLISIVIYHCILSNPIDDNKELTSIENKLHKLLNDNIHLIVEQNFYLDCDCDNRTIKLWLK